MSNFWFYMHVYYFSFTVYVSFKHTKFLFIKFIGPAPVLYFLTIPELNRVIWGCPTNYVGSLR